MSQKTINITGVSLCKKAGRIRIFRSTIKRLGEPKYIRFLFNPEKQLFAVQASDRKDSECFYVPKCSENDWNFVINSIPMLRIIWKVCKWDEEKSYRISGTYHAECNLVVFDLKQAVTLMMNEIE